MTRHTSTSVSLALGLAKGRDLNKRSENIIALMGTVHFRADELLDAHGISAEKLTDEIIRALQ